MLPDQLESTRLTLRPFVSEDAQDVYAYWQSDPGWQRFNASVPEHFTERDAQHFVEQMMGRSREDQPNWALVLQASVVGVVSLTFEQAHRVCVIGYGVHGNVRGQGLAREAAQCVLSKAFEVYSQLHKVRAHTAPDNVASISVLQRLGFVREGTLRSN